MMQSSRNMAHLIWFSILGLLAVLVPVRLSPMPEPVSRTDSPKGIELPFPLEDTDFNSMKSYIDDFIRNQWTIISNDSSFFDEVDEHYTRFPNTGTTKIVTRLSRDICHCAGKMMSPCPDRCIYSCYLVSSSYRGQVKWRYEDDCRDRTWGDCKCTDDKDSASCYQYHQLENCYNSTTESVPVHTSCSHFTVDKDSLIEGYKLIKILLMEPLKTHIRVMSSRLISLERAFLHLKRTATIGVREMCSGGNDSECITQANQIFSEEKGKYLERRRNIALELIKTQTHIEATSQKVAQLQEKTLAKINSSLKKYSCCLKVLDFSLEGYDCTDETIASVKGEMNTAVSTTTSTSTTPTTTTEEYPRNPIAEY